MNAKHSLGSVDVLLPEDGRRIGSYYSLKAQSSTNDHWSLKKEKRYEMKTQLKPT